MKIHSPLNRVLLRQRSDIGEMGGMALDRTTFWKYFWNKEAFQPGRNLLSSVGWLLGLSFSTIVLLILRFYFDFTSVGITLQILWALPLVFLTGALLGSLGLFWGTLIVNLENELKFYKENSELDHLSGLKNRRGFEERLSAYIAGFRRGVIRDMALLFLDIDHFKKINDTYGHSFGDLVIKSIAEFIERKHRGNDFSARWGGEEFVILAMGVELQETIRMAERIREGVEQLEIFCGDVRVPITISMGVTILRAEDSKESFIERADNLLYEAKEGGRNQVRWVG